MEKPTNFQEMAKFLSTLSMSERTNVHGALVRQGWATNNKEAEKLMNDCGFFITLTSDNGWEPGIT